MTYEFVCIHDSCNEPTEVENDWCVKHKFQFEMYYYKRQLHAVLQDCDFNGAGMRQLMDEFTGEVLGS